jgi:hypothetical protein
VPHLLTDDLRQKRKEHANVTLSFIYAAKRDGWHYLVTDDKSWFGFNTSPRHIWTLLGDNVAIKPRFDIQSEKFIFTIIWNPTSFYVVDKLPNDTKTNSANFVTNILTPLEQVVFPRGRAPHQNDI